MIVWDRENRKGVRTMGFDFRLIVWIRNLICVLIACGGLLGCRTVLHPDKPSRLWDTYFEQNSGITGPTRSIPCPTRMASPQGQLFGS